MYRYGIIIFVSVWISSFGKVPAPVNLTMYSVNFKNILQWNLSSDLGDDAIYRVHYKLDFNSKNNFYKEVCITNQLFCDLTMVTYASYVRVRAEVNDSVSDWAKIHFDPYQQTIIGPPEVTVSSRSGFLDVSLSGPKLESDGSSLKDKYGELLYIMAYWKELDPTHVITMKTSQNTDILNKLEKWTTYCLKVQAYIPEYNKTGRFSPVVCEKTTDDGRILSWKIAVLFLGAMVITIIATIGLTYAIFKAYKMTRYIFFPSYSFPQHLKEYLSKPFYSTPHLPTLPTEEYGESCEQLTFVSEENEATNEIVS
ncbi:interleukin-10 receptor subunit beta-like [Mixophyes fleayi]|uniref:interleukin-10 receptor subunit beta-like n=1 Tax=Mixophyes fleayi TaxID=3061075 RepID=UPI003F4DDE38